MDSAFTRSSVPGLGSLELQNFKPYIPEDFANFEVYNASLETQGGTVCVRGELAPGIGALTGPRVVDKEVSRSPTASSCTSGYFSHSASNATLSDVLFSGSDSCDQLNNREAADSQEHGRGLHPSRTEVVPSQSSYQVQTIPAQHCSRLCTDQDCSPPLPRKCILSVSQEFTDFKGADDGVGVDELCNFSWKAESIPPAKVQDLDPPSQCHLHNGKESHSVPVPHANPELEATRGLEFFEDAELSVDSNEDENAPVAQLPDWMAPGEQVWVGKRSGMVHYVGGVEFAKGIWVGVELDLAVGK